jgi:hypothetical protein
VFRSVILLCLSGPGVAAAATPSFRPSAGAFDFSAVDRLWAIVSVLEGDGEPTAEDWDGLVRTPGYAALVAHERGYGLDFLTRNLRLVFKPSLSGELEKAPRSNALRHFLELKEKKAVLKAFQAKVQQAPVWGEAIELLKAWLPAGSIERCPAPTVAFVVFARDARGGYGPLIFDLLYAFDRGDTLKSLAAHEMFHYYHRELPAYDPARVRQAHRGVLDALGMIQGEGLADQIDKAAAIEAGSPPETAYDRDYRKYMADSPRVLATLDDLLCRLGNSSQEASRLGSRMRAAIPMNGHPTGYFMTRAVLRNGGKADLIRTFGNPFAFVYLYNAAAARNPTLPRLSNLAVSVLRTLERLANDWPEAALARAAVTEGVDSSSVTLFRTITAALEADREPEPSLWDALFRTPGHRVLFAHEGDSRGELQEAMSLAFKPSRKADLDRALESGSSGVVRYVLDHKKDGEAAARAWEQWQQSGAFERTMEQTWAWLPGNAREVLAGTTVALTHLGAVDLRYGYEALLVDPLWIRRRSPDGLARFVRLNLIWRYMDAVRPYDEEMLTRRHAAFLGAWEDVQRRGLGDLVNREAGEQDTPEFRKAYDARLQDVGRLLSQADAIMKRAVADRTAWRQFETLQRDFFFAQGSPLGYFMASTCKEVLGREALAATVGRPIAFLQAYQTAARRKGGLPILSAQSLDLLAQLEREARAGGCCVSRQSANDLSGRF